MKPMTNTMQRPDAAHGMPAGQTQGNDPEFEALVAEIAKLIQEGKLPEGFDLEEAASDPELMKLMREYGAEDADNSAMERGSARVRERGQLPKSTRGGSAAPAATNYRGMSSEAFRTLMQQMKKTARDGGKTRL